MADGRFAPSPTGPLHLGNLRTALLAWLFARSSNGRFLVRIDDLDAVAARPEHERSHLDDLQAVGLDWDGAPVRQSARRALYDGAIARLVESGVTYPCYCTRREVLDAAQAPHGRDPDGRYPGTCRDLTGDDRIAREATGRRPSLRLRADGVTVTAHDRLHGEVTEVVDDFVIRRNDGTPAYNLAVVVDDADQGIDEVVRGDDLLPTTPRQVHLATLLGVPIPAYAHVPLVLGPDGERIAKRHGAVTLSDRMASGESADDVRAVLARSLDLASPGEVPSMATLLSRFDPDRIPRRPWTVA